MELGDNDPKSFDGNESERNEYELAVKTQMHFNELLMKFRSFGVTVVVAIYSYAVGRPSGEVITTIGATPSQVVAIAGIILAAVFALLDIFYFFPLLLGAVRRALTLEKSTTYRLTSTITSAVPKKIAYFLIIVFYIVIVLSGALLAFLVLPAPVSAAQSVSKTETTGLQTSLAYTVSTEHCAQQPIRAQEPKQTKPKY